jgi:4-amino-4-deoxy-L-arabinose transferase-like glycosyltransferase
LAQGFALGDRRDMAESGDWVTPRLYGHPWFEKPPLFYWGAAISFNLCGVNEAAARLPSAISALLATLAMAWLAWRLYGAETARWLLLLLPTTVGMIGFSHAAATDMPFSAMLTVAMVFAASIIGLTRNENSPILPRTPWLALIFFGFFLGLAVLAKGPAAIILSGGAVLLWAVLRQTLARCLSLSPSRRHRQLLPHRSSLVPALFPPQSRILPCLHHRAQLPALPNTRIPAHPAFLVLYPYHPRCCFSLDHVHGFRQD